MRVSGSTARLLIKIVISAGLLAFLFGKISIEGLLNLLASLDIGTIVGAMLVFFFSNLGGAFQWHRLLVSSGVRITFPQSFRFYFVGLFFNNFLPANVGGDAVKIYDVTRHGSGVYQVFAVTLLDRLIGIFSLCLLACVAVIGLSGFHPVASLWVYLVIFLGCMTPLAAFYFVGPLSRVLRSLVGMIRPLSVDRRASEVLDYLGEFKSRRWLILKLVGLSLVVQFLRVSTHVLVAVALGIPISATVLNLFFVFVPLLGLAMVPPITINGLGVREGLGILLFAQADIGRTDAFAIEFLTYLVSVAISLIGVIFFVLRRRAQASARPDSAGI